MEHNTNNVQETRSGPGVIETKVGKQHDSEDKSVDNILRVVDLTKRYDDLVAVDGLGIEVRRGEILGFLGPNGAGKTTSLKMMCGLLRPDGGTIELNGKPLVPGKSRGLREIGVAPQNLAIWETLTCVEQLELIAQLYGQKRKEARSRAEHLLRVFGLTDKARRLGRTLSGGMQRRLNIALGLVHEPEILFLDEPQAGLDPQSRVLVRDYIQSLKGKMTIVITTHDMEEAEKLADRICIIDRGKLLVLDTLAGLERRFGDGEVTEVVTDSDVSSTLLPHLKNFVEKNDSLQEIFTVRENTLVIASAGPKLLARVLEVMSWQDIGLVNICTRHATLEDVFIGLTGRSLRE